ncbi:putative L-gulonolactone oxidase 6 [Wolffia australiana]
MATPWKTIGAAPTSLLLLLLVSLAAVEASPPEPIVKCKSGNKDCSVTNTYGAFPDRSVCQVAAVAYPTSEAELIAVVSAAAAKKQHMKVVTEYGHSIPKLACPGGPSGAGLVISTQKLNRVLRVDAKSKRMTFEAGITLSKLISAAAVEGLALPYNPYWQGITLGGLLATGSHGSSLFGKGSAVHEYVVGMRLVVPQAGSARVVDLGENDPDLLAAKVSLGVLGVVSQVTLQLEPMFKRSITYRIGQEEGFESGLTSFAEKTEFGDVAWYAGIKRVVFRDDIRLPLTAPGKGNNDFEGFQAQPSLIITAIRKTEELLEATKNPEGRCLQARVQVKALLITGSGLKNDKSRLIDFTGYPVVGNQSDMQASGSCLFSPEDGLFTACGWDSRLEGLFYYQSAFGITLPKLSSFIADVKKLRELRPSSLCGLDLYQGLLMRFVRNSTAYLGKEDCADIDMTYFRSRDPEQLRLDQDVLDEVEQMAFFKYGALPHWGKNRHVGFIGVAQKLGDRIDKFVAVMEKYDPDMLFSSDWTDAVLGIRGKSVAVDKKGCALEGLCVCSRDEHCAPEKGYYCRRGLVYKDARVCRKIEDGESTIVHSEL